MEFKYTVNGKFQSVAIMEFGFSVWEYLTRNKSSEDIHLDQKLLVENSTTGVYQDSS